MQDNEKKLDKVFSLYIRSRHPVCLNCSGQSTDCAHIIGRGSGFGGKTLRWYEDNAVGLCRQCHRYYTDNPSQWSQFIEDKLPGRIDKLKYKGRKIIKYTNYDILNMTNRYRLKLKNMVIKGFNINY